ncbi:hypothetical protein [Massilia sp.]|uniref:hypothetical protein n=1 Tax=Massilia sp. TaxID=1882437 RepID=UPI0028B26880|nr:hypothetical protein [Massilia sp.]
MRLKFTYIEAAPVSSPYGGLQEDVRQFFQSVKSRAKTTAEEGDALLERALPHLASYSHLDPLNAEDLRKFQGARDPHGQPVSAGQAIHNTLHEYEQRYMNSGLGGKPGGKSALQILLTEFEARFGYRKIRIAPLGGEVYRISCETSAGPLLSFGTLYVADSRFVDAGVRDTGLRGGVYVDRDAPEGRHYIKLPDGSFVKRFVMRGLSAYDAMRLWAYQSLTPTYNDPGIVDQVEKRADRHGTAVRDLDLGEQVLSHTRGWKKRFISTGTSERSVYSTRGTQFKSLYGAAVIDLAKLVNQHSIVDVHQPAVAARHLGNPEDLLTHGTERTDMGLTDIEKQQYMGLRDVVRTRELLIHGDIDHAAVRAWRGSANLIGLSADTGSNKVKMRTWFDTNLSCLSPAITSHEIHDFRDMATNRFWIFMAFQHDAAAEVFSKTRQPAHPAGGKLPDFVQVKRFGGFSPREPERGG